jgi:hypothetical protein
VNTPVAADGDVDKRAGLGETVNLDAALAHVPLDLGDMSSMI